MYLFLFRMDSLRACFRPSLSLRLAAVGPKGDVSGAIWVRTPPQKGVIENISVLVDDDEDGLKCAQ